MNFSTLVRWSRRLACLLFSFSWAYAFVEIFSTECLISLHPTERLQRRNLPLGPEVQRTATRAEATVPRLRTQPTGWQILALPRGSHGPGWAGEKNGVDGISRFVDTGLFAKQRVDALTRSAPYWKGRSHACQGAVATQARDSISQRGAVAGSRKTVRRARSVRRLLVHVVADEEIRVRKGEG